jgi:hypothetical protein
VRPPLLLLSAVASAGLVLLVSWWFEMPLSRAAVLAPVIVVAFGAAAGLLVLWSRVVVESIRRAAKRPVREADQWRGSGEPGGSPGGR